MPRKSRDQVLRDMEATVRRFEAEYGPIKEPKVKKTRGSNLVDMYHVFSDALGRPLKRLRVKQKLQVRKGVKYRKTLKELSE